MKLNVREKWSACGHESPDPWPCPFCRIAELESKLDKAEQLLATAYQLAGLVGAPVRFLDAYSRHEGDIDSLLPVNLDELDEFKAVELDEFKAVTSRLDQSQKALGLIYNMAKGLPADLEPNDWLREIQEVCGQVWKPVSATKKYAPWTAGEGGCPSCRAPQGWPHDVNCIRVVERQKPWCDVCGAASKSVCYCGGDPANV